VLSLPALAAEMAYCQRFADAFAEQFKAVTEREINPWFHARAYSRCLNSDEDPKLAEIGTAPAAAKPKDAPDEPAVAELVTSTDDAWKAKCRARFRSWDEVSQTVVRYRSRQRVPCPVRP
jgi:hypothetical protein